MLLYYLLKKYKHCCAYNSVGFKAKKTHITLNTNYNMAHDILISYSSKDKKLADAVCNKLETNKIRVWMAPRDITPGKSYAAEITKAIRETKCVVLLFNKNSFNSQWVRKEVERAVGSNKIIIPFRLEDIDLDDEWNLYISSSHWLNVINKRTDEAISELLKSIKKILEINTDDNEHLKNNLQAKSATKKRKIFLILVVSLISIALLMYIFSSHISNTFNSPNSSLTDSSSLQVDSLLFKRDNIIITDKEIIKNKNTPEKTLPNIIKSNTSIGKPRKTNESENTNLAISQIKNDLIYIRSYTSKEYNTGLKSSVSGKMIYKKDTLDPFFISKYEITQFQWESIMGTNPSINRGKSKPVDNVSYSDVTIFINKLNSLTNENFRLPKDVEWNLAAYNLYFLELYYDYDLHDIREDSIKLKYVNANNSWGKINSDSCSHKVGTRKSNKNGIYDMFGNVWEYINMEEHYSNAIDINVFAYGGSYKSEKEEVTSVNNIYDSNGIDNYTLFISPFCSLLTSDYTFKSDDLGFRLAKSTN